MGVRRYLPVVLAVALLAAPLAMGQSGVLCSQVNFITGWDGIACVPLAQVTRGVTFSLTYVYTQPYTTSPPVYQSGGVVHDGGSGICTTGSQTLGPYA